jgi:hypothetical protein
VTDDVKRIKQTVRWSLVGVTVLWLVIAAAYFGINDFPRWYPYATGVFALGCAGCTGWLALRPGAEFAYQGGGALAVGALLLRGVTIVSSQVQVSNNYLVIVIVQVALTVLLLFLYANWWLVDVKDWHRAHHLIGR